MNPTSFAKVYALWHGTQAQEQLCGFGHTFRGSCKYFEWESKAFCLTALCYVPVAVVADEWNMSMEC